MTNKEIYYLKFFRFTCTIFGLGKEKGKNKKVYTLLFVRTPY
ncbi:hypothetical protein EVA_03137 [gut metagenome]|uniref:Uncharacterized protein n=1 Tax=gut metagenome TaxID=749906 RepID=J9GZM1_9ZZZZ